MIIALAGLITFPLLTRNLSVVEYGILGLIMSSLTFLVAIGKLGVQHSVIRFFSQVKNNNIEFSVGQMSSTVLSLLLMLGVLSTTVWLMLGYLVLPSVSDYPQLSSLVLIGAAVIFLRLLGTGVTNFLRAQQRSGIVATATLISRCIYVSLVVLAVVYAGVSPFFAIFALFVAEVIALAR